MLDMVKQGRLNRTFDGIDEFRLKYEWHNIGNELKNILDIYR
jgi:hypothetical protein